VLGVDDWARRRGHTYGTVLVDLERQAIVDLLPERSADDLEAWLAAHPGVEVVSRDRAECYAEGTRRGAPDAVQVADRWDLLRNVRDVLERVLQRHRPELRQAAQEPATDVVANDTAAAPAEPRPRRHP
jgi:transposase